MMVPRVSIIIPTYFHVGTVRETLDSVFARSFSEYIHCVSLDDQQAPELGANSNRRARDWTPESDTERLEKRSGRAIVKVAGLNYTVCSLNMP